MASFHDSTHRILDWHRSFYLGDTAQTLDPDFQEMLEAEANYGASALMFCGPIFTEEALDTSPEWASVVELKKRYDQSFVTTLRRYVEHSHELPMVMVVSTPYWMDTPDDQQSPLRHFVRSAQFKGEFSSSDPERILLEIDRNIWERTGGPVGDFGLCLQNDNCTPHEFRAESFFNRHYVLTMIVHQQKLDGRRIVLP